MNEIWRTDFIVADNDLDGIVCAVLVKSLVPNAEVLPTDYPGLSGMIKRRKRWRNVLFADINLSRLPFELTKKLCTRASSLIIVDQHRWKENFLSYLRQRRNVRLVRELEKSTARLIYDHWIKRSALPRERKGRLRSLAEMASAIDAQEPAPPEAHFLDLVIQKHRYEFEKMRGYVSALLEVAKREEDIISFLARYKEEALEFQERKEEYARQCAGRIASFNGVGVVFAEGPEAVHKEIEESLLRLRRDLSAIAVVHKEGIVAVNSRGGVNALLLVRDLAGDFSSARGGERTATAFSPLGYKEIKEKILSA